MATTSRAKSKSVDSQNPQVEAGRTLAVRFSIREFATPPVHDALVLGKQSPIGCVALRKALVLMQSSRFDHIEFEDDVISDIIARESVVRVIGRETLINLVVQRVKPYMTAVDILHLDINAQLSFDTEIALADPSSRRP